jgi:hypothetical protein
MDPPSSFALSSSSLIVGRLRSAMKFDFKIKTEPTLHALVAILIVAVCSGSLASIAIYLNNPLPGIYCATVLAIIVFLALRFNSC